MAGAQAQARSLGRPSIFIEVRRGAGPYGFKELFRENIEVKYGRGF